MKNVKSYSEMMAQQNIIAVNEGLLSNIKNLFAPDYEIKNPILKELLREVDCPISWKETRLSLWPAITDPAVVISLSIREDTSPKDLAPVNSLIFLTKFMSHFSDARAVNTPSAVISQTLPQESLSSELPSLTVRVQWVSSPAIPVSTASLSQEGSTA